MSSLVVAVTELNLLTGRDGYVAVGTLENNGQTFQKSEIVLFIHNKY